MKITHPDVIEQQETCIACPAQYEGKLADGRFFYFRFRFGKVQLGIGETPDKAVEDSILKINELEYGDSKWRGDFNDSQELTAVFTLVYGMRRMIG